MKAKARARVRVRGEAMEAYTVGDEGEVDVFAIRPNKALVEGSFDLLIYKLLDLRRHWSFEKDIRSSIMRLPLKEALKESLQFCQRRVPNRLRGLAHRRKREQFY